MKLFIPLMDHCSAGFLTAGLFCDVKRLGTGKGSNKGQKRDLAVIVSEVPATAAGMFTTNQICAAPVKICVEHIARNKSKAQAVVINPAMPMPALARAG